MWYLYSIKNGKVTQVPVSHIGNLFFVVLKIFFCFFRSMMGQVQLQNYCVTGYHPTQARVNQGQSWEFISASLRDISGDRLYSMKQWKLFREQLFPNYKDKFQVIYWIIPASPKPKSYYNLRDIITLIKNLW